MSRCQHGSPRSFLSIRLYRLSLPGGLQGYFLYRHRAVVYRLLLVVLPLLVHVKGFTGIYCLGGLIHIYIYIYNLLVNLFVRNIIFKRARTHLFGHS